MHIFCLASQVAHSQITHSLASLTLTGQSATQIIKHSCIIFMSRKWGHRRKAGEVSEKELFNVLRG